ncbi:hypothetical protein ABES36_10970 [Bacillus pseudomycoides]|nr:hypothetical protein [Bacillus pseudomycoides]
MVEICVICKKEIMDYPDDEVINVDICYDCETEIHDANIMELAGMGEENE